MFTVNVNFSHVILECRMGQWIYLNYPCDFSLCFLLPSSSLKVSHKITKATFSFTIKDYVYKCHMSLKQTKHTHKPMKYLPFRLWINMTLTVTNWQEHIITETPQWLHQIWQISHEHGKMMQLAGGKNQMFSTFQGQRRFWLFQQVGKGEEVIRNRNGVQTFSKYACD